MTAFTGSKINMAGGASDYLAAAERRAGQDLPQGPPLDLNGIGIVGGGTMGAGIAAAVLLAGLPVWMVERDARSVDAGRGRVLAILADSLTRGVIDADDHARLVAQFSASADYESLSQADLVIEAVFEDLALKRRVFETLDTVAKPGAVLASNTSYLDVGAIAGSVRDPARVIGLHFFSPAYIMKLLELVVPDGASDAAVAMGAALGRRLRKVVVPSGVCDGFIGNRIMAAYRRACDEMVEDGALPHEVDRAMRDFGFRMGVFEMQDLAGLDIAWAMRKRRGRVPGQRYVAIADRLCELGRFGRKARQGWYRYDDGKTPVVDPQVTALIEAESARLGITRAPHSAAGIMAQILTVMQSEGRAVLKEGIAARASDIDVVMVNGYGFPRDKGGPMYMADGAGETT
ncbi:3-hydroxyacyl-CoA dehydrogenase family protein [uncultured Litoreibacter sp.]|uniref:3-hydroxyacyl-CoA dehydrogenase family protein n=1 Tax=uncultured Litoreibacter sp. TaxID=1392394 RepID=UPI00262F13D9|nr:3-hydroxyacyl-CoA dehydrogenase family protein [uncultured Litoreibacter sp.]